MSLSLKANADGISLDLMVGATLIAKFSTTGIEAGGTLLADAATAQGLTDLKKLLSPGMLAAAFQGANQSFTANGYQKLPGGLIAQWGSLAVGGAGSTPVTFPIAFPTGVLQGWCSTAYAGTGSPSNLVAAFGTNYTTTGFNVGSTGNMGITWLVIGR